MEVETGVWIAVGLLACVLVLLGLLLRHLSSKGADEAGKAIREEFGSLRKETEESARKLREEVANGQKGTNDTLVKTIAQLGQAQTSKLEDVRTAVDRSLQAIQTSNEKKLEEMRQVVDDKLQTTLEKRLGESFKRVSEHLEAVNRGLGEMQELATGVGELKRVFTNIRARGTWGEVQLKTLLEQILTPEQYDTNVRIKKNSKEVVEFAVRLPGNNDDPKSCVWLPIDCKFPLADYYRLVQATDVADKEAVRTATAALQRTVQGEAKKISEKYIAPPKTTDIAILFLPTEGLYAEVLRQPGQVEALLQRYRIVVAGPTTLSAILSSLRMGFRTLAIEKRSSEVWKILAAVNTEFDKFSGFLSKVRSQLETAAGTLENADVRTRAMKRKLREVEKLPSGEAAQRLGLPEGVSLTETDLDEGGDLPQKLVPTPE